MAKPDRDRRAKALIYALAATLLKPAGAQRNTQNPHIVNCEGIVATSATSLPAPTVSPLHDNYREEIGKTAAVLNAIRSDGVQVVSFASLSEGVKVLADIAVSSNSRANAMPPRKTKSAPSTPIDQAQPIALLDTSVPLAGIPAQADG